MAEKILFNGLNASGGPQSVYAGITDEAQHVTITSDYRGSFREDAHLNLTYTLTTTTAVDTSDVSGFVWGSVTISGLTLSDTVSITELPDGTTVGGALLVRDPATLATNLGLKTATALANGTYYFSNCARKLRIAKTADAGVDASVVFAFKAVGGPL